MSTALKLDSLAVITKVEEEGIWVDVKHPSGDPFCMGGQDKQLRIRVAGAYSETARAEKKRNRDEIIKRRGRSDADDAERRELKALAACTLEWQNAFDDDGKEIPLTKSNAAILYSVAPFIEEQLDAAGGDHARFFEKR